METHGDMDFWQAHADLEWQIELGATEAICETPINRYELPDQAAKPKPVDAPTPVQAEEVDPVAIATERAKAAQDIEGLRAALEGFEHCTLKHGARNLVFSDGLPSSKVMIIGEAPGREEDRVGKPFVGNAGQLLDQMFAAIGLSRTAKDPEQGIYITNTLPWRPPENRDPTKEEIAMMTPFLKRHIELADPKIVVLVGNWACTALLGRAGITRLRGQWQEVLSKPAMPMTHPAYLLRQPLAKREAWVDLLAIKAKLEG